MENKYFSNDKHMLELQMRQKLFLNPNSKDVGYRKLWIY